MIPRAATHIIEPFYPDELQRLLRLCVCVLKIGGGMRIVVANLANTIVAFQKNVTTGLMTPSRAISIPWAEEFPISFFATASIEPP